MRCPHCGNNLKNIALVIPDDIKAEAIRLREEGKTLREVKALLHGKISIPTIYRITSKKYKYTSKSKFIENKEVDLWL